MQESQNEKNDITDVEFKEIPTESSTPEGFFNPVNYLTDALREAGYHDPEGWTKNIDVRAANAVEEKDRIFFANRALRLYLAEIEGRENISPRMLLADGIDSVKWKALMDQGVIPWLLNQFDAKGKRKTEEAPAADETITSLDVPQDTEDQSPSTDSNSQPGSPEA